MILKYSIFPRSELLCLLASAAHLKTHTHPAAHRAHILLVSREELAGALRQKPVMFDAFALHHRQWLGKDFETSMTYLKLALLSMKNVASIFHESRIAAAVVYVGEAARC